METSARRNRAKAPQGTLPLTPEQGNVKEPHSPVAGADFPPVSGDLTPFP